MIITNNAVFLEKAKYFTTQAKDDPIFYIHNEVGYNFNLQIFKQPWLAQQTITIILKKKKTNL